MHRKIRGLDQLHISNRALPDFHVSNFISCVNIPFLYALRRHQDLPHIIIAPSILAL